MLLRQHRRQNAPYRFSDQLNPPKLGSMIHLEQKSTKNFELTISILDMLIEKNPKESEQLLIVKKALSKWFEHISQQSIAQKIEIASFKQSMTIAVKEQFRIILEDIAYYLRTITQDFHDTNLNEYYSKYLSAIKKFSWLPRQKTDSQETQTETDYLSPSLVPAFHTQRSIERQSLSTIESPTKKYKEVDLNKYIQTKEQNLQLERKCDRLGSMIAELEEENMKLRAGIDETIHLNRQLQHNNKRHLEDIQKLSKNLEALKSQELDRRLKEEKIKNMTLITENRYRKLDGLKDNLHRQLEEVYENILEKERQFIQENKKEEDVEKFFMDHYQIDTEPSYLPMEKKNSLLTTREGQDELRMLLVQCKVLEELFQDHEE